MMHKAMYLKKRKKNNEKQQKPPSTVFYTRPSNTPLFFLPGRGQRRRSWRPPLLALSPISPTPKGVHCFQKSCYQLSSRTELLHWESYILLLYWNEMWWFIINREYRTCHKRMCIPEYFTFFFPQPKDQQRALHAPACLN